MDIGGILGTRTVRLAVFGILSAAALIPFTHGDIDLDDALRRAQEARRAGDLLKSTRILVRTLDEPEQFNNTELLAILNEFSDVAFDGGRLNKLFEAYEFTIRSRARTHGPEAPETLQMRSLFGRELMIRNRVEEARAELGSLLTILERQPDPAPSTVARTLSFLARAEGRDGDPLQAISWMQRAVNVRGMAATFTERNLLLEWKIETGDLEGALASAEEFDEELSSSLYFMHEQRVAFRRNYERLLRDAGRQRDADAVALRRPPVFENPPLSEKALRVAEASMPGDDIEPPIAVRKGLGEQLVRRVGEAAGQITIRLVLYIDEDGLVQGAEVFSCNPEGFGLEQLAIDHFWDQEFYPALRNGEPVPYVHLIKIDVDASFLGPGFR